MPLLILWYLSTDEVKAAFGIGAKPAGALDATPVGYATTTAAAAAATLRSRRIRQRHPSQRQRSSRPPRRGSPSRRPRRRSQPRPWPPARSRTSRQPRRRHRPPAAPAAAPAAEHHAGIEDVEGIGPAEAEKLAAAGITTTAGLLQAGAKPDGRARIAAASGISSTLILEWVNHVDLMRIKGVGSEYSDLLELAGVDSPAELAHRNATNLATTIQEVVAARPEIVRRVPTEPEIAGWIQQAATLEKIVEH